MTTRLSPNGYSLPKSDFTAEELATLKRELTAVPLVAGGKPSVGGPPQQSFHVWQESATRIYLPKCFGLARFGAPAKDTLPTGSALPSSLRFRGEIRPEQAPAVEAFMTAAADPLRRGGIVSLPCGGGKTVIALNIVARVAKKTMIIVHKDFLLRQWHERISAFLPDARVGLVKAKTVNVRDKDVVIASLQSLSMKEYADDDIFAGVGLLIIDEVHRTGTEVFSRALQKASVSCCLGLSATVERKDGMTKVFSWFIGGVVYARAPATDDRVDVALCTYNHSSPEYGDVPEISGSGKPNVSRMINNVTSFPPRTRAMCDAILEVLHREPRRRVLVLSDRKQHLRDIADRLSTSTTVGMYVGGMKAADLEASQDRTVILATYSFASEGFDVPGLDTLVLASPKTDIEQSVGRVLRQRAADRARVPLVLDVVDGFSVFRIQAQRRKAYYKKRGYRMSRRPLSSSSCDEADRKEEDSASLAATAFSFRDEDDGEKNGDDW